jgi:GAF domain-containing protein
VPENAFRQSTRPRSTASKSAKGSVPAAAAVRGEAVISADIAQDALWKDFAAPALGHNLRACWSVPIVACDHHRASSASTKVHGTFALYFNHPKAPRKGELGILHRAAQLAGIAIERERFEKTIVADEARFRTFVEHASDAFILMRDGGEIIDVNSQACESLGYAREELIGRTPALFSARARPDVVREVFEDLRREGTVTLIRLPT